MLFFLEYINYNMKINGCLNFDVNPNFLFEKREVCLYSWALTYVFSLVLEFYNNQLVKS